MNNDSLKDKIYPWLVCFAVFLVSFAGIGMYANTNGPFIVPVTTELGIGRGNYTLHRSIISIVSTLSIPVYSKLFKKGIDFRVILTVSACMGAIALLGWSVATSLWQIYLFAFIRGCCSCGIGFLTFGPIIVAWFEGSRGLAQSLAFSGASLGSAIFVPITTSFIQDFGWRVAYRYLAVIGLIIMIPAILLLIRNSPESMGLTPFKGGKPAKAKTEKIAAVELEDISYQQARRMPMFWLSVIGCFTIACCCLGPNSHSVAYFTDIGYSAEQAAAFMSGAMVLQMVTKIVTGVVYDRYGTIAGGVLVGLCALFTPIFALLAGTGQPIFAWIYGVPLAFATAAYSIPHAIIAREYYGKTDFSQIYSTLTFATTLSGFVSVSLMGYLFDVTGSYRVAWYVQILFGIVACICFVLPALAHQRRVRKAIASQS